MVEGAEPRLSPPTPGACWSTSPAMRVASWKASLCTGAAPSPSPAIQNYNLFSSSRLRSITLQELQKSQFISLNFYLFCVRTFLHMKIKYIAFYTPI
jgi:hypothetical protein